MVISVMDFNSEAGFLQSSFVEFVKCWSMGTSSTFHVESRNGQAFLNFSAFLGQPRNVHFINKKSKSERKFQRDCERAAKHRAKCNESSSNSSSLSTPLLKMKENLDVNKDVDAAVQENTDASIVDDDDQILNLEVSNASNNDEVQIISSISENDATEINDDNSDLSDENDQDQEPLDNSLHESFEYSDMCEHSEPMCRECKTQAQKDAIRKLAINRCNEDLQRLGLQITPHLQ